MKLLLVGNIAHRDIPLKLQKNIIFPSIPANQLCLCKIEKICDFTGLSFFELDFRLMGYGWEGDTGRILMLWIFQCLFSSFFFLYI